MALLTTRLTAPQAFFIAHFTLSACHSVLWVTILAFIAAKYEPIFVAVLALVSAAIFYVQLCLIGISRILREMRAREQAKQR